MTRYFLRKTSVTTPSELRAKTCQNNRLAQLKDRTSRDLNLFTPLLSVFFTNFKPSLFYL